MRRGLLSWSHDEVPPAVLAGRLSALTAAMRCEGIGAVLIHTDFTRSAAVSRLTQFVPYWGRGVVVVTADGAVTFANNLSNRVSGWMRSVSALEDIVCGPAIGAALAARLPAGPQRVAVVEPAHFPDDIIAELLAQRPDAETVDGTALFEAALGGQTVTPAVRAHLLEISAEGLAAGLAQAGGREANAVVAAAERHVRLAAAEEVLVALAPDATASPLLRRIEGGARLGPAFTLHLSVAYKGFWLRRAATVAGWAEDLDAWFAALSADPALATSPAATVGAALDRLPVGTPDLWRIEAPRGGAPLAVVAGSGGEDAGPLTDLASLTVRIRHPQGWWLAAGPVGG